jgi:uncharacterized membrane protein
MLKKLPYALMVLGAVLLLGGIAIGARSSDAQQIAFFMGVLGVFLLTFGFTLYMFTEGVAGRRTGG